MTNREYLSGLDNSELISWLSDQKEKSIAQTISKTDWGLFKNFQPSEFVCGCKKCEYSKPENVMDMDPKLLWILQAVRNKYKKAITITCGVRCEEYNNSLPNAVSNSYHLPSFKKAADFYISGVTSTEAGRDEVIAFMKQLPGFKYAYHNKNGSSPLMGAAVHVEVK